jgi:hypothetical protein
MERRPSPVAPQAPPETTITRRVGRDLALVVLAAGQLASTAWLFAILATSESRTLSRAAFAGYLIVSAGAWMPAAKHPGRAVLTMSAGCAALLGLLIAAGRLGG